MNETKINEDGPIEETNSDPANAKISKKEPQTDRNSDTHRKKET